MRAVSAKIWCKGLTEMLVPSICIAFVTIGCLMLKHVTETGRRLSDLTNLLSNNEAMLLGLSPTVLMLLVAACSVCCCCLAYCQVFRQRRVHASEQTDGGAGHGRPTVFGQPAPQPGTFSVIPGDGRDQGAASAAYQSPVKTVIILHTDAWLLLRLVFHVRKLA